MRAIEVTTCLVGLLATAACGGSKDSSQAAAASQAQPPAKETAPLDEPTNPGFIGRVWVATTPGNPRGAILVFLPDRSLLMDSCFETYRISQWGVAGDHIRWLEDTIPIEADVSLPSKDELVLKIAGSNRQQTYVAASVPYVCPPMPR